MKSLSIGGLRAELPVIQGGMGVGISRSSLASAVADAGGIGVISATGIGMLETDFFSSFMKANRRCLIREIRKTREKTEGVIGVNLMVALSDYDELFKTAYDEKVDIVFVGAGLPLKIPEGVSPGTVKNSHTKFAPIVSSARAAKIIFNSWDKRYSHIPDAVVVEGPEAGGHLGFTEEQLEMPEYQLESIAPEVVGIISGYEKKYDKRIPVIAAGGIYSGADIYRILKTGVSGVQMGTRFVATYECDAAQGFKESYLKSRKEDIAIINSPVGLPGRVIKNDFLKRIEAGHRVKFSCPCRCLKSCNFSKAFYCIALALTRACRGNMDEGFAFAGKNAHLVREIISVKDLFRELVSEFEAAELKEEKTFAKPA